MKIKGRENTPELHTVTETLQQDAVKILTKKRERTGGVLDALNSHDTAVQDRADIEMGRAIQSELDPAVMLAERQQKVAEIKRLVQAGKYNPKSEDVAKSLAEEISLEILHTGGLGPLDEV